MPVPALGSRTGWPWHRPEPGKETGSLLLTSLTLLSLSKNPPAMQEIYEVPV